MFDMVDTAFSYGREMIVCLFLQESLKVKESSLYEIQNADTAFLLGGAEHREFVLTSHRSYLNIEQPIIDRTSLYV